MSGEEICAHSSHLNDHLNESAPVYFISTLLVGLYSSIVFVLLTADGAVTVASKDSEKGSISKIYSSVLHRTKDKKVETHHRVRSYTPLTQLLFAFDNVWFRQDRRGPVYWDYLYEVRKSK